MKAWLVAISLTGLAILTLWLVYPNAKTTFDITAEAESLTFTPHVNSGVEWELDGVRLRRSSTDTGTVVSGTLALSDSVRVLIERKSLGPLRLQLEPRYSEGVNASLGSFTLDSVTRIELRTVAFVEIGDLQERVQAGRPVVLFGKGDMTIGWVPNLTPDLSQPLLRSGTIRMVGKSWFRGTSFSAGTEELRAGDKIEIAKPLSTGVGFISADERPALTISFRTIARSATVTRPGGGTPQVSTSLSSARFGDPMLKAGYAVLVLIGAALFKAKEIRDKLREWRLEKMAVVCTVALCAPALLPSVLLAQSVGLQVSEVGDATGQGITRPRNPVDCFIVTPNHVIGRSSLMQVTGEGVVKTVATAIARYESADLAVLSFVPSPAFPCPEWNVPGNLNELLVSGATSAVLRSRDAAGNVALTPVWITSVDRETIRVSRREPGEIIQSGMSGSQLIVNGQLAGMVMRVTEDGKTGIVMRSDNIVRVLGNFFTTVNSPIASDAVNLRLIKGESTVLGDQYTAFGYYDDNGSLGIRVRLNGDEHQMSAGMRLPFPDSRGNCFVILIRYSLPRTTEHSFTADFRIACTPK
jgi:hypothetical protein